MLQRHGLRGVVLCDAVMLNMVLGIARGNCVEIKVFYALIILYRETLQILGSQYCTSMIYEWLYDASSVSMGKFII